MKTFMHTILFILANILFIACSEKETIVEFPVDNEPPIDYTDTSLVLKNVANFPIGASVSYNHIMNDPRLASLTRKYFDEIVFNSELKHGAIIKSDGSADYSTADAFVNWSEPMTIYGHVLAWHRHQNTNYLNKLVGNIELQELMQDGGFETTDIDNPTHWRILNSGNPKGESTITITNQSSEVKTGTKALKVINPTAYGTQDWRVQIASHYFRTVPGQRHIIKYWAKSTSGSGIAMVSAQAADGSVTHYPGGDKTITGDWQQITLNFTPTKDNYRLIFNLGKKADTYLIDDVSVYSEVASPDYDLIYRRLDTAFRSFITTTVTRYKDKIKKWEVVNEIFTDQGHIRNNNNSPAPIVNGQKEFGYFLWSEFLKRDYGYLAFKYAALADPTAELYINDYGLEYSDAKIDSLISYVNEIKRRGATVHGISSQMHIDIYLSQAKIDKMFQKLASTGLKVRVSELDIRITNSQTPNTPSSQLWVRQKEQYERVVASYVKFVPPAQRAGISVWGVVDKYNWQYYNGSDFPNLFDSDYAKKQAYAGFLLGLADQ